MIEIDDDAVVLRTYKSGEADRVVVLWTRHHGKVRVLAKAARKTTSRLGGTLETLAYVNVDLVKTRGEFYVARHVRHRERLATLRSSYERISACTQAHPLEISSTPSAAATLRAMPWRKKSSSLSGSAPESERARSTSSA